MQFVRTSIVISEARGPDRRIVYANPAFESLTGYSAQDVVGRDCRFLQNDDRDQLALRKLRLSLKQFKPVRAVVRNYRKDGTLFFNEISINPIRNELGDVTHFVGRHQSIEYPASAQLRNDASELIDSLTRREREVFEEVIAGRSNKQIARILDLSPRTVEKHRLRMQKKMGTTNLSLLVRYAIALRYEVQEF